MHTSIIDVHQLVKESLSIPINAFPIEFLPLLRLAAISSPPFLLLVAAHTRSKRDIDSWWRLEAEALRDYILASAGYISLGGGDNSGLKFTFDEVKFVHVED